MKIGKSPVREITVCIGATDALGRVLGAQGNITGTVLGILISTDTVKTPKFVQL